MINVSLFASSVRPKLWKSFFKSLIGTSVKTEVRFAGNSYPVMWYGNESNLETKNKAELSDKIHEIWLDAYQDEIKSYYKSTENIKPAQCYEIARRACVGEVVVWVADDCEFPNDVIGKAYRYWKEQNNEKLILSIQTRETGYNLPQGALFDMDNHRFFGYRKNTPLMAPLGLMSRQFLNDLGGIDRRYVCGQYENDIVMRAICQGGKVEVFGGQDCFIDIDHLGKSKLIKESHTDEDFLNRPFAKGYPMDRAVLESSWVKDGRVSLLRNDVFEPFEDTDILIKSQSNKGIWE